MLSVVSGVVSFLIVRILVVLVSGNANALILVNRLVTCFVPFIVLCMVVSRVVLFLVAVRRNVLGGGIICVWFTVSVGWWWASALLV